MGKGGHPMEERSKKQLLAIIRFAHTTQGPNSGALENPTVPRFRLPAHSSRMRPPSFWSGSICHLPPTRGGSA